MVIGQSNRDGSPRVLCSHAKLRANNCIHTRSYCLKQLESTVLAGIKDKLTNRKALLEFTRAYHDRWAARQKAARTQRDVTEKQLNRVTVQIDRAVTAITDSDEPVKGLVDKLKLLEIERVSLTEKLRLIDAEANVITLHPKAIDQFAESMEELHAGLTTISNVTDLAPFRAAFRNVFERIAVHPTPKMKPCEVTPYARIGAIMGFEMFPKMRSTAEMLAEQGVAVSVDGISRR
jgi:hypothetical protein